MRWAQRLAEQLSSHGDSLAVIRAGRKAKLRTRRRDRHAGQREMLLYAGLMAVAAEEWQPPEDVTLDQVLDAVRDGWPRPRA